MSMADRDGKIWKDGHMIDWRDLMVLCRKADIIVSERLLPRACIGRWLTIDPRMLRQTGGMAIALNPPKIETVRSAADDHPWMAVRADLPQYRRSNPAKRP